MTRASLLTLIGEVLVTRDLPPDTKQPTYAIVLCGEFPNRVMEAAALFHERKVQHILLSNQVESNGIRELAKWGVRVPTLQQRNLALLQRLGIPLNNIELLSGQAHSTRDEASIFLDWLKQQSGGQPSELVLVTSATHTFRAQKIFKQALHTTKRAPTVRVQASRYGLFRTHSWWQEWRFVKEVVLEYQKLLLYLFI